LTQVAWKTGLGDTGFNFFREADQAIESFFTNATHASSGFDRQVALLATATIRAHEVRDHPYDDDSESNFPLVHVWSGGSGFETLELESGGYAVRARTRVLVWTVNARPETAAEDCIELTAATASMIQQTYDDTNSEDWSQHYANWPQLDVAVDPIEFFEFGEENKQGLVQGRLVVTWTHNE